MITKYNPVQDAANANLSPYPCVRLERFLDASPWDPYPRVEVDGVVVAVFPRLPARVTAICMIPLALCFAGGAVGAVVWFLAVYGNFRIARSGVPVVARFALGAMLTEAVSSIAHVDNRTAKLRLEGARGKVVGDAKHAGDETKLVLGLVSQIGERYGGARQPGMDLTQRRPLDIVPERMPRRATFRVVQRGLPAHGLAEAISALK